MINLTALYIQTGQPRKCGAQWLAREHPPPPAAPGRSVETSTEDDAQGTTAAACMYAQSGDVLAPTHCSVVPSSVPPQGNSEAVSYPPTCTPVTTLHSTCTPTIRCTLPHSHSSHTYLHTSTIPYAPLTSIPLSALSSPPLACINVPALAHLRGGTTSSYAPTRLHQSHMTLMAFRTFFLAIYSSIVVYSSIAV